MKRSLILLVLVGVAVSANLQAQCGPPLPVPHVAFVSTAVEPSFIRYTFTVTNHALFSNVFFTPLPNLPPCGLKVNSSRTWLNIFNANGGAYIYGYCGLTASSGDDKVDVCRSKGQSATDGILHHAGRPALPQDANFVSIP